MKPEHNEVIIEDGESFRIGESYGIREVVLEQYRKCINEGSKEMSISHIRNKMVNGNIVEIDMPNQREVFINSVMSMEIALAPFIRDFEETFEQNQKIDSEINNIQQNAIVKKNNFMNAYNEKVGAKTKVDWSSNIVRINMDIELKLVELYRKKLVILSMLLNELDYLGEASASGG